MKDLFMPLARCIKRGELHNFDVALQEGEEEFIKRKIYLTLERGRDIALRNLLRKVFLAGEMEEGPNGPVRRTRIPLDEFIVAISLGSQEKLDRDEVECLLANMIYKVSQAFYLLRSTSSLIEPSNGGSVNNGVSSVPTAARSLPVLRN